MHDLNKAPGTTVERLCELLADRAAFGLDAAAERELADLLRDHPAEDAEAYDRIESSEVAEPLLLEPFGWPIFAISKSWLNFAAAMMLPT